MQIQKKNLGPKQLRPCTITNSPHNQLQIVGKSDDHRRQLIQVTTTSYSTVVLYSRDHAELGFSNQKYHPKNQPQFPFMTTWLYWLGTAKPKNVFRSTINPSKSFYGILKISI